MIERRRQPRIIFKRQVVLNNAVSAMGLDLSEGGIYIQTGRYFPVGSVVSISLPLNNSVLNVSARVQHSKPGAGMGLMFMNMTHEQAGILRYFLQQSGACSLDVKKVLIIDCNATTRKLYKSRITLDGFTAFEAANKKDAMGVIAVVHVDLVLMDLLRPDADGFEALSELRAAPGMNAVPILVISAKSSPGGDMERALKAGATEFIPRMLASPARLGERIKLYLNASQPLPDFR
ncbi:MAG: response regulator [Nitrospiraceae bacterium]|nr:response regulator [Nitrospiraceae bacterium]